MILNKQFITLKGVLKPFQFYQQVTFGLDYIDEVHLKKIAHKYTACSIKTIEQEEFRFGDFLSISEQRWIANEIQEFIQLAMKQVETRKQEDHRLLIEKKVSALDLLLTQGISCYENELIDNAKNLFESAIIINPICVEAHNNLGIVQLHKGQYLKAIEEFDFALNFAPSYWSARVNLAIAYETQGNFEKSIKIYATPCPIGDKKGEDKYTLSLAINTHQSLAEAISSIQELNPCGNGLLETQNQYAYLLHLQGHAEVAIRIYKDALKLTGKNVMTLDINENKKAYYKNISEIHANLGWTLAMVGQKKEALVHLKKSSKLLKHSESELSRKVNALIDYYQ